jgi:hypothetical protein
MTLKDHLLGNDHIERIVVTFKEKITAITWSANNQKRDFLWYVSKHAGFHTGLTT